MSNSPLNGPPGSSKRQVKSTSTSAKPQLDLSTPPISAITASSSARQRLPATPSHLLPATALFRGPNALNDSHTSLSLSLSRQPPPRNNRDSGSTPIDHNAAAQHLPRAQPPTSSFSVSRPVVLGSDQQHPPTRSYGLLGPGAATASNAKKPNDDFHPDAVWAEMQRTLADVELSAMNSSHVFSSTHASALEDLRMAQLGLAGAWARSEKDEGIDEEFGRDETGDGAGVVGGVFGPASASASRPTSSRGGHGHGTGTGPGPAFGPLHAPAHGRGNSRPASTASHASTVPGGAGRGTGPGSDPAGKVGTLEEETERDIMLARRRREANDRYFRQVNKGVLEVVKKLDEVASAMRRVEKESREIWNDNSSGEEEGEEVDEDEEEQEEEGSNFGETTETDRSAAGLKKEGKVRGHGSVARTPSTDVGTETDTELLTDSSPATTRRT